MLSSLLVVFVAFAQYIDGARLLWQDASRRIVTIPLSIFASIGFCNFDRAYATTNFEVEPRQLVQIGMNLFKKGSISESIQAFDEAIKRDHSLEPFMWQRGISLYYDDKYKDCSEQFRKDVAVNPNDIEEVVWAYFCDAKEMQNEDEAKKRMIQLSQPDSREVMKLVYDVVRGIKSEDDLSAYGNRFKPSSASYFYSQLYLALIAEARHDPEASQAHIQSAVESEYGRISSDYMTAVARNHLALRNPVNVKDL